MNPPTVSDATGIINTVNDFAGPLPALAVLFLFIALVACYMAVREASKRVDQANTRTEQERQDRIAAQEKLDSVAERAITSNEKSNSTNEAMVKSIDLLVQKFERMQDAQRSQGTR